MNGLGNRSLVVRPKKVNFSTGQSGSGRVG